MGRKAFVNDLKDASIPGRFAQVSSVASGDDDGTVRFVFEARNSSLQELAVDVMLSDVSDYPGDHQYLIFTSSDNVPHIITTTLESVATSVAGFSISQMLVEVSSAINDALSEGQARVRTQPVDQEASNSDGELLEDEDSDGEMWSPHSPVHELVASLLTSNNGPPSNRAACSGTRARVKADLLITKEAGFKVGVLGNMDGGGIACVSIRIGKLDISEEAMNAWALNRNKYLIVLIRYPGEYKTLVEISEEVPTDPFRTECIVGLCQQYKPSYDEATAAFRKLSGNQNHQLSSSDRLPAPPNGSSIRSGAIEPIFISASLNDLLIRLPSILKYRIASSFTWTGAETFQNELQATAAYDTAQINMERFGQMGDAASKVLPKIATADHVGESPVPQSMSFPLAAMQFVIRHVVRCTEFCSVCHCKIEAGFEALKPYVCSKPLCLFQYMALGFGPSIDWEIMSQPYVVDLLISFCYVSAQRGRLKDFPTGLNMKVPLLSARPSDGLDDQLYLSTTAGVKSQSVSAEPVLPLPIPKVTPIEIQVDIESQELRFGDQATIGRIKPGDWVVIAVGTSYRSLYHARIEYKVYPTAKVGALICDPRQDVVGPKTRNAAVPTPPVAGKLQNAKLYLYDQSFDELPDTEKMHSITIILDTLPDVVSMKEYLATGPDQSLKRWRTRISETALSLLRWIIASNRSCIMQVDQKSSESLSGPEDRVTGMPEWMQFRFAQGAPDKEQRFIQKVNELSAEAPAEQKQFPTIFAWHGSPLNNWHSIIREGLHFNDTAHGRAFGHGVYMSLDAQTSMSYIGASFAAARAPAIPNWPNSKLMITCAMTLNEVVNAPHQFVSASPHLVVSDIDWIQTRYLFVQGNHTALGFDITSHTKPKAVYEQDPRYTARGTNREKIAIPITAVSKSRRPAELVSPKSTWGSKKAKVSGLVSQDEAEKINDDAASVVTTDSDTQWLISDSEDESPSKPDPIKPPTPTPSTTDFIPNTLDPSTLSLLAPPLNASSSATKSLLKLLQQTVVIQDTTPPADLGWSISHSIITNIYQWPFEIHSLPADLPLATDLLKASLRSIVLEIRFPTAFPMTPPFVRVIRPRFLPFAWGGGGHVTAGGALCMELLTNSGWSPVSSLESVLLQVRMAICSTDPHPARLMSARPTTASGGGEYSVAEAVDAYKRACQMHGWEIPRDIDEFLTQSRPQPVMGGIGLQGLMEM